MNLKPEEQILIKDIFNVSLGQADTTSQPLKDFPKEVATLGPNASLVENPTYFDSLLMERLQIPGTEVLAYLQDCLGKCNYVIDKPWNQSELAQKFIKYSIQIIHNFIFLSLQEPDLFSEQLQIDLQSTKIQDKMLSIAMKLMTHFERRGFNMELFNIIYSRIEQEVAGDFGQTFLEVLLARERFQTIIESKAYFYLNLLVDLMGNQKLKMKFFNMKKAKFIPGEISKIVGSTMDSQSPFGLFMRMSILGFNPGYYHQENEINIKFEERMIAEFGKERLGKDRLKFYGNLQNDFYAKYVQLYKLFMKKDTQKQFLDWNYAVIVGNLSKFKLGSRLHNANNSNLSHDGMVLNIYYSFLQLCKVILDKNQDKYKSIDPEYFIHNPRIKLCKYETINKKSTVQNKMEVEKEYGTITEFFFLAWQFVQIGLVPAQDNFVELAQAKQKMEQEKKKIPPNHPMMKKLTIQIQRMQSKMIRYYVLLLDDEIIRTTVKLFDMLLFLLPKWLEFSYEDLHDGIIQGYKIPELALYLPQFLLDSMYKFHLINFKFKQSYLQMIGEEHISGLVTLTCLLLSQMQIVSNPYIAANYIELLFYFLHQNKSGIMTQVFRKNHTAHYNLTEGLIRFYCDIAVTGVSHAFYSKFKYRLYVNKIFTSLWLHQVYRQNLKSYFHKPVFQKFLNMVMTDTNYCFDEANQNYEKFKGLELKKRNGPLSAQDQKNEDQVTGIIHSTLNQSASNLKLMRDLSAWSPNTFLSQTERRTVVPLLNNILKTFVDPTTFVANRQLIAKFKFQKELVLSDLLQIYVNIDINQKLSQQIIKDTRNYKKEYFSKALQKASNQHYTGIDILQKFEQLIKKLSTAVNEEQNEQIYGQIPEKYLCGLMSTLMKDPVLLPGSGNIVDRVNIHRHLLNDERDPFTRAPLKISELQQQKDLRLEIEDWKKKRMEELKKGDKELKYGQIAVNKKDGNQDDDVFGEKKLDYQNQMDDE